MASLPAGERWRRRRRPRGGGHRGPDGGRGLLRCADRRAHRDAGARHSTRRSPDSGRTCSPTSRDLDAAVARLLDSGARVDDGRGGAPRPDGGRRPRQRLPQRGPLARSGIAVHAGGRRRRRHAASPARDGRRAHACERGCAVPRDDARTRSADRPGPVAPGAAVGGSGSTVVPAGRAAAAAPSSGPTIDRLTLPRRVYWCPTCQA